MPTRPDRVAQISRSRELLLMPRPVARWEFEKGTGEKVLTSVLNPLHGLEVLRPRLLIASPTQIKDPSAVNVLLARITRDTGQLHGDLDKTSRVFKNHTGKLKGFRSRRESLNQLLQAFNDHREWLIHFMASASSQLEDAGEFFPLSQLKFKVLSLGDIPREVDDSRHLAADILQWVGDDFRIQGLSITALVRMFYTRFVACRDALG
jgi:hypothetical protein